MVLSTPLRIVPELETARRYAGEASKENYCPGLGLFRVQEATSGSLDFAIPEDHVVIAPETPRN